MAKPNKWLRHTRRDPPTPREIMMNEAVKMRTRQRAEQSDRKHQAWKLKVSTDHFNN